MRNRVLEFAVRHDLISSRLKWELAVSAVGSMYRNVFYLIGKGDRSKLADMMKGWGHEHSEEILKRIGASRDLHGCAMALMTYHRIFGMDSSIVKEAEGEVVMHVSNCMWKNKRGWTPEVCASMEAFEAGLAEGINPSIRHYYTARRSLGDEVCEMHLTY